MSSGQRETHRSLSNEVRNGDKLASVRVNERLEPGAGLLVADLEDVGQDDRVVVLDEPLEGGLGEVLRVELAVEGRLSRGDRVRDHDGGLGGSDLALGLGDLDEGGAERDDLVVLVEGDVGDGVGEGDAVQHLLDIDVAGRLRLVGGADLNAVRAEVSMAGLNEGDRRVFDGSVGALGQGVVDTLPESLDACGDD